jgi:uncharacterized delta-60 repeat protein
MNRAIIATALVVLLSSSGAAPIHAATGDLDHTFGGYGAGGRVLGEAFPGTTLAATALQSDGKVVAVGSNGQDFVVARYDASGRLDSSFGTNGVTTIDFAGKADIATAVAISPADSSIVVVGLATIVLHNDDFAIARLLANGSLDPFFSQDGKVMVDFNGRNDHATAIIFDGSNIVVAGAAEENPPTVHCFPTCNDDFGLADLNHDGSLNQGFGINGKAETSFGGSAVPQALAPATNGFYAVGSSNNGTSTEYVIARYGADGMLNTTFNGTGYRTGSTPTQLTGAVGLSDNSIVVIGSMGGNFGLLKFDFQGSPDLSFGGDSTATVDFGGDDLPQSLLLMPDDTIYVAGSSGARLAIAHLTSTGQTVLTSSIADDLGVAGAEAVRAQAIVLASDVQLWVIGSLKAGGALRPVRLRRFLDGTADDGGRQIADFDYDNIARTAVFQPDRKLLVAGNGVLNGQGGAALVRYTAAGALDPSFDGDARLIVTSIPDGAVDIALQPDGKILVAGRDFAVARLKPDGSTDKSFNGTGYAQVHIDVGEAKSMLLQPDGKIVLAGIGNSVMTLVRFDAAGRPDPGFGFDGVVRTGLGLGAEAFDIAIQPDGKLVAAGATAVTQTDANFALVRYNPNGSLDPSFDGDGKQTTDFGGDDEAVAVVIQPDGAIVAAGTNLHNGAAFARYRPNGALDSSFNGNGKQTVQILGDDLATALVIGPTGFTAAVSNLAQTAGVVVRLTPDGKLDTSVGDRGRLPFRFAGADCPLGLAREPGRIAAVGYAHYTNTTSLQNIFTKEFAVAVYQDPAAAPSSHQLYLPDIQG